MLGHRKDRFIQWFRPVLFPTKQPFRLTLVFLTIRSLVAHRELKCLSMHNCIPPKHRGELHLELTKVRAIPHKLLSPKATPVYLFGLIPSALKCSLTMVCLPPLVLMNRLLARQSNLLLFVIRVKLAASALPAGSPLVTRSLAGILAVVTHRFPAVLR